MKKKAMMAVFAIVIVLAIVAIWYFTKAKTPADDKPKPEVYYYDQAGNDDRYKLTLAQAKNLATSLKGQIATPEQIRQAQSSGLDSCWIGWGSDGLQYIPSITDWGALSSCYADSPGVQSGNYHPGAGVYVYGPKPAKVAGGDCSKNPPTPCATPWSPTKWSQYA